MTAINAQIDVKKYQNRDVKNFQRGATVIPGATFIPESRVVGKTKS